MEAAFLFWFKNYSIAHLFSQRYPMNLELLLSNRRLSKLFRLLRHFLIDLK